MRQSRKKWERKREEQRNKVIALLFIVMMVIFCVVNIATADRKFSAKENRALEQRPKLTISGIESGRWMKQYESYVSDQFAGRDFWVALKSRIDLIAGKRKANGVFKGKDHYLLEDIARPDEEQLKVNLDAMKKFQETYKNIPMYMMLVPNAANIEPIYIYAPDDLKTAPQVVVNNVNEKKKTATLYDTSKLKEKDKYALFLGGNYPVLDIRTTADTTDRLLLVKDSYANSVIPFLTAYYREIIVVDPRYYYDDIREVMKKNKITSVLFLYNGNTFVQDNSISGVLQND